MDIYGLSEHLLSPPRLMCSPYLFTRSVFAQAVLLHAENRQPVNFIDKKGVLLNPLHGTLNAFCQYIRRPTLDHPDVDEAIGALVFPDLSVRHEGMYCIAFMVWEVDNGEVFLRGIVHSNTFRVYAAKEFPGMSKTTEFTESLKSYGIRVRVSKSLRSKRATLFNTARGAPDFPSRESTPDSDEDEHEETVSLCLQSTDEQNDMMNLVPPGGVLPIPLHSSPVTNYHDTQPAHFARNDGIFLPDIILIVFRHFRQLLVLRRVSSPRTITAYPKDALTPSR